MSPLVAATLISLVIGDPGPRVDLHWQAPPECPDQAAVRAKVDARLAEGPAVSLATDLIVTATDSGFALEVVIESSTGRSSRRLEAATCDELIDAVALLLSLGAIEVASAEEDESEQPDVDALVPDPSEPSEESEPVPIEGSAPASVEEPAPAPTPALASKPAAPVPPRSAPGPTSSERRLFGLLGAHAGLGALALPAPTLDLSAHGGLGGRGWEVSLGASYWVLREATLPGATRGRFQLALATVRGCGVPTAGRIDVPLCGGLAFGGVTARGTEGLSNGQRAAHPWVGATVDAGIRWWVTARLGVTGRVGGLFAFARPRFDVGGIGPVCCRSVGIHASAGLAASPGPDLIRSTRNGSRTIRTITRHAALRALPP